MARQRRKKNRGGTLRDRSLNDDGSFNLERYTDLVKAQKRTGNRDASQLLVDSGGIVGGGQYTVQANDSWFSIAGSQLGNQINAGALMAENPTIGIPRPGMTIQLPSVPREDVSLSYAGFARGLQIGDQLTNAGAEDAFSGFDPADLTPYAAYQLSRFGIGAGAGAGANQADPNAAPVPGGIQVNDTRSPFTGRGFIPDYAGYNDPDPEGLEDFALPQTPATPGAGADNFSALTNIGIDPLVAAPQNPLTSPFTGRTPGVAGGGFVDTQQPLPEDRRSDRVRRDLTNADGRSGSPAETANIPPFMRTLLGAAFGPAFLPAAEAFEDTANRVSDFVFDPAFAPGEDADRGRGQRRGSSVSVNEEGGRPPTGADYVPILNDAFNSPIVEALFNSMVGTVNPTIPNIPPPAGPAGSIEPSPWDVVSGLGDLKKAWENNEMPPTEILPVVAQMAGFTNDDMFRNGYLLDAGTGNWISSIGYYGDQADSEPSDASAAFAAASEQAATETDYIYQFIDPSTYAGGIIPDNVIRELRASLRPPTAPPAIRQTQGSSQTRQPSYYNYGNNGTTSQLMWRTGGWS